MAYQRKTKDLHISPKLIEILEKISNKSEIAKKLLRTKISIEDLVDNSIDYIAISKDDPNKISYAYSEKLEKINPDEYWSFKGRVHAKPASAIKKFLKNITEKDLDIFTCLYKAAVAKKDFEFKIVSGEDIKKYYRDNIYHSSSGSLYQSCMKHDFCHDYFQVYINNPEICTMLILVDFDGYLLGRALLWDAVDIEEGSDKKIMDRIYTINDDHYVHFFKDWADENMYLYKKEQKWNNTLWFESKSKSNIHKLVIKIKNQSYLKYPYVDTFKFWDEKNSTLTNFNPPNDNGYIRILMGSDGRVVNNDIITLDTIDNIYYHKDNMVTLNYDVDGIYHKVTTEKCNYSECMEFYIYKDHSFYDEDINDYIFKEEFSKYNEMDKIDERRKHFIKKKNKYSSKELTYLSNTDDVFGVRGTVIDSYISQPEAYQQLEQLISEYMIVNTTQNAEIINNEEDNPF